MESAAEPGATVDADLALQHLNQLLDDRETEPCPSGRSSGVGLALEERQEHAIEIFLLDACARILHPKVKCRLGI